MAEYKILYGSKAEVEKELNAWGKDGWRAIHFAIDPPPVVTDARHRKKATMFAVLLEKG